jgi:CubicO group peptidase (beta-lactamase class C family)
MDSNLLVKMLDTIWEKNIDIHSVLVIRNGYIVLDAYSYPQGITLGYGELFMQPQDMAKIGYLYLNNGLWDGEQIISSLWIKASTRKHIATTLLPSYGYHWWIVSPNIYTAAGNKGQFIMVAPEKNMVAVFTGRLSPKDFAIPLDFLAAYLIPAVKSSTTLPENPQAEETLQIRSTLWQSTNPSDRENMLQNSLRD